MIQLAKIGSVTAVLSLDKRDWKRKFEEAKKEVSDFDKKTKQLTKGMSEFGAAGVGAFALIAVAATAAVRTNMAFEQSLKDVQAITKATDEQMSQLANTAHELGAAYGMSATDIVNAAGTMVRAGASLNEVLATGAKATVELAAAANTTTDVSAELLAVLGNVFDEMKNYAEGADLIAGASNAAAGGINDIKFGLASLGAVAKSAGLDAKETLTFISSLTNAGLTGSDAGTAARSFIQFSIPETEDAIRVAKEFGLITAENRNLMFDQSGKMKNLADVAELLREKFGHLNNESRTAVFTRIWGSDAARAALGLMDQGRDKIDALQRSMERTTATEAAAERMDTLTGSVNRMKAEFENASNTMASAFNPMLRDAANGVGNLAHGIAGMSQAQKDATVNLTATTLAMGGTATAVVAGAAAMAKMRMGTSALGAGLTALTSTPVIGWAIALVGVLTTLGVTLYQNRQEVERFHAAQAKLNDLISKDPMDNTVGDVQNIKAHIESIERLKKQYEELSQQLEAAESAKTIRNYPEIDLLKEQIKGVTEEMRTFGVTAEDAGARVDVLNDQVRKSIPALMEMKQAELQIVAADSKRITQMETLSDTYSRLSQAENLSADQKLELRSAATELQEAFPSLIVEIDREGVAHIRNINILGGVIEAERALVKTKQEALRQKYAADRQEAASALNAAKAIVSARIMVANSYRQTAADDSFGQGDNVRLRQERMAAAMDAQTARIQNDVNYLTSLLASIDGAIAQLGSGNFTDNSGKESWGSLYDPKYGDTPKKDSAPSEQPWEKAQRERREAYERELVKEEDMFRRGIHGKRQYAEELSRLAKVYYDVMRLDNDEFVRLQGEISRNRADSVIDSTETLKRQMEERGKTATEIAQMEIKAYEQALAKLGLLAEDKKRLEEALAQASRDKKEATFDVSADWIATIRRDMEAAGASELDIAQAIYDAWGRVNARRNQGIYLVEDERRAVEELKNAELALRNEIADELRRARELDLSARRKDVDEWYNAEQRRIQEQIDALDEQASAEQRLIDLRKERERVAEDKRFELIRRGENGELIREMVADLEKIADIDKQIRDEETRKQREALEQELEDLRKSYDEKTAALDAYRDAMLGNERLFQDARAAIEKAGMQNALTNVRQYLADVMREYEAAQAAIIAKGGLIVPPTGSTRLPSLDDWTDRFKANPFTSQIHRAIAGPLLADRQAAKLAATSVVYNSTNSAGPTIRIDKFEQTIVESKDAKATGHASFEEFKDALSKEW